MATEAIRAAERVAGELELEYRQHLVLMIVAAIEEAAGAFREADALGCFTVLERLEAGRSDPVGQLFLADLELARRQSSTTDKHSLWNRVVVKVRNNAGAHWSEKLIARALKNREETHVPAFLGRLDQPDHELGIPVGQVIVREVVLLAAGFDLYDQASEQEVSRFAHALTSVAHCIVAWTAAGAG